MPRRTPQAGFTLIELMISMVLGLLIVLALVTLLINVNRTNNEMSKTNRVIENGRFAMQLLQADLAHAAFWDGYLPPYDDLTKSGAPSAAAFELPSAVPDPCLDFATPWDAQHKANLVYIAVQGYEIPDPVPSPTVSNCASIVTSPQANTDVLVVRHAEACDLGTANCSSDTAGEVYFQVDRCSAAGGYVLDTAGFTLTKRDCTTVMPKRRFVSNIYYIRDYAVTPGDGIPTLMRSEFGSYDSGGGAKPQHKPAVALIEGIEGFKVEYGIDNLSDSGAAVDHTAAIAWASASVLTSPTNRGDGIPDGAYVRCAPCTANQLMNTVALRIHLLVRGERASSGYTDAKTYNLGSETMGPFNDGFKRHAFTQTIRLVNMSSRRETP